MPPPQYDHPPSIPVIERVVHGMVSSAQLQTAVLERAAPANFDREIVGARWVRQKAWRLALKSFRIAAYLLLLSLRDIPAVIHQLESIRIRVKIGNGRERRRLADKWELRA